MQSARASRRTGFRRLLGGRLTLTVAGALALVVPAFAAANTVEVECFAPKYDKDGDGWAKDCIPRDVKVAKCPADYPTEKESACCAVRTKVKSEKKYAMSCPPTYAAKGGDCNDNDINIHPDRNEVPWNGVDDNCNGLIDETEYRYFPNGNENTNTSFKVTALVNSVEIASAKGYLFAQVSVRALSESGKTTDGDIKPVSATITKANREVSFVATGLQPATVYQADVQFLVPRKAGGYKKVGEQGARYTTITKGSGKENWARSTAVLRALYEADEFYRSQVGYRGLNAADGTRYGADLGEWWCSEFYVWTVRDILNSISKITNVTGLMDYFKAAKSYEAEGKIQSLGRPGDYIAMDTSDPDTVKNHSAMFLAFDKSKKSPTIWTVEGNDGNRARVRTRKLDDIIAGLGRILPTMTFPSVGSR